MKSSTVRFSFALALLPMFAVAGEPSTASVEMPVNTTAAVAGTDAPAPAPAPAAPASALGVRNAISNAFRASDESVPCVDGNKGVGCTIASTALGSALHDEREADRASQFLRDR